MDAGGVPTDARLPRLTLQPLIENAIYHGIEPLDRGGSVRIEGSCEAGVVHIEIRNPLPPRARRCATADRWPWRTCASA